jgi:prevent-host-death family protein
MITENVAAAKAHLTSLMAAAERGEEVFIARRGQPAIRLVPVSAGVRFPIRPCPQKMRIQGDPAGFNDPAVDPEDIEAYR